MSLTDSREPEDDANRGGTMRLTLAALVLVLLAGLGFLGMVVLDRLEGIESQVTSLSEQTTEATDAAQRALERAQRAEEEAREAADGRLVAEAESARAQQEADLARTEADRARNEADEAFRKAARTRAEAERTRAEAERTWAEAERIRKEAEAEITRLHDALNQVVDTRRTALGLVMRLGEDYLKFDFDKAELRPENRELLSRIAGILLTSSGYTVSVNGHTDDIGTHAYNQKLSERRARAVRDYLVKAGIPKEIITVKGWGKTKPLVPGKSSEARAKNRRVELGIVNTRISYGGVPVSSASDPKK